MFLWQQNTQDFATVKAKTHTDLSLKLFSKGIQVQIFQTLWIFQDLLQSSGRVGIFCRLIILEGVHSHLASPLVCLRVDTRSIQNLDVGVRTVCKVCEKKKQKF